MSMTRRVFLAMAGTASALLAHPQTLGAEQPGLRLGKGEPFPPGKVASLARALAARPFEPPPQVPDAWLDLDYDQYRDIRFRPEAALWRREGLPFEAQFFSPGFYFRHGVPIAIVENAEARRIQFDQSVFRIAESVPPLPADDALNYSGFRLHTALNRPDYLDEFVVFQGASYLRAVGKDQAYGLSARGLAVATAEPQGEEFPIFRAFWIETPAPHATSVRVHALLDSVGVAGAYRFDITPGEATMMDVEAMLFPRTDLPHVGIAPLTSMFLYDGTNRSDFDDFRLAVHDSDGLMVANGNGEWLWRPLANPETLQVSQFLDSNPKGFGLVQRKREIADFVDLEARYELRPSAWIEPDAGWGRGSVALVEIPTDREINDNIVAYWRPAEPLKAGSGHRFGYRLTWCWQPPIRNGLAATIATRMGAKRGGGRLVVIDFEAPEGVPDDLDGVTADMAVRPGKASPAVIQRNPDTGGVRLAFSFDPGDAGSIELRAQLRHDRRPLTEVWLYRWTP